MSNNILEPIPSALNDYLLKYNATILSSTTPAAPGGNTNVTFQSDGFGNISAYSATGTGAPSVGTAGQVQKVGATAGSFAASSITDNGTTVVTSEPLSAASLLLTAPTIATSATAGAADALPDTPLGYVEATITISGTPTIVKIPFYSV